MSVDKELDVLYVIYDKPVSGILLDNFLTGKFERVIYAINRKSLGGYNKNGIIAAYDVLNDVHRSFHTDDVVGLLKYGVKF
jgi:hypothetical protein